MAPDACTLAEVLQSEGYTTAAFVTNPNVLPVFGFEKGFDRFVDIDAPRNASRADRVNEVVLEFLDEEPEGPLFLYVHTMDPHYTYDPPTPYDLLFTRDDGAQDSTTELNASRDRYDGEIAFNDREMGRLLSHLERRGILSDAIVVLLSDHGEEFRDHGRLAHGKSLFQEQILVPFAIHFPRGRMGGRVIDSPVRIFDLLPTLCDFLGIEAPANVDGGSLMSLIERRRGDSSRESVLFSELDLDRFVISSVVEGDYKLIKTILPAQDQGTALFDLRRDPGEKTDLRHRRKDIAERLERLHELVETGLRSGLFVELVNAKGDGKAHRATGTIRVEGGTITAFAPSDLEESDGASLAADSTQITFDVELANRPDPTPRGRKTHVDADRIRFRIEPPDARFRVTAAVNGATVPEERFVVGAGGAPEVSSARGYRANDPHLERAAGLVMRPGEHPDGVAFCRIYSVRRAAPESVEVGAAIDERLRALGYVD